jgi:predicted transglutaminase-like cysteine proteinase
MGGLKSRFWLGCLTAMCAGVPAATSHAATWLKTGALATRPYGHVAYCASHPSDCGKQGDASILPAASLSTLQNVNISVNRSIRAVRDQQQFGVRDKWSVGGKSGDCEDFALAKRSALMRRGFKRSHLLMAVGSANGEVHAVLVVRTRDGDFVLDNLTDAVLPVGAAHISIAKIQSSSDSSQWLRVTGRTSDPS